MTTSWQDIQREIEKGRTSDKPKGDFDAVRRFKYGQLCKITGRPLLVYATAFHNPLKAQLASLFLSIDISDKDGFYEITHRVKSRKVDVFLHSPGGSAEATESVVKALRSKFEDVRFIITGSAKSAATMLAMSGNTILMDQAAEVGPIDPQVRIRNRFSPAGSIIEQFDQAARELQKDPSRLPVWIPILQEFAPALIVECENYINLSKKLVRDWLQQYMFKGTPGAIYTARKIANYLTDEKNSLSHARRIDVDQLENLGLKVERLELQPKKLQDAVRQVHLSIMATLEGTDAIKIFENSEGDVLIRMASFAPMSSR